jgi:hypothetical protein
MFTMIMTSVINPVYSMEEKKKSVDIERKDELKENLDIQIKIR